MLNVLTNGKIRIGAYSLPDRKKIALCVEEGNEIVSESSNQEESIDPVTGQTIIFSSDSKERVVDDDTVDVPQAYLEWQEEHL